VNADVDILNQGISLLLKTYVRQFVMNYGIVFIHLFMLFKNGATLDYGNGKAPMFDMMCPDGGKVHIHGEKVN
jgi:hypothetical protein